MNSKATGKPAKAATLAVLVLFILFALVGCGRSGSQQAGKSTQEVSSGSFPVTVTDTLGRKVTINSRPERISTVAPSVTETLFDIGAGNRVVGVTTSDDYPRQVKKLAKVGDAFQVNAEKVASLKTDVLFLSFDSTTRQTAQDLQKKTGAKVVVVDPKSVNGAIDSIGTVGKVSGDEKRAAALEKKLRGQLAQVRSAVKGSPRPTVFYELGYDPLYTVGPGSFVNDALNLAGGKNVVQTGQPYPEYSVEKLLKDNPDFYLVGSSSGASVEGVKKRPAYGTLAAVKKNKVFVVNDNLLSRPGPRIVEGVREVAKILHPNDFR